MHALSTWRNDLNRALESKFGQYYANTVDNNRRNTIYGYEGELVPNSGSHLNVVSEDDELLRPASPGFPVQHERPVSARTFGPDTLALPTHTGTDRASSRQSRNSLATLISVLDQELRVPHPPLSSTSEVTLFDPENFDPASFDPEADGPLASSTPHESQRTAQQKHKSRRREHDVPPVPKLRDGPKQSRRSSIRYIVSDENAPVPAPAPAPQPVVEQENAPSRSNSGKSIASWSARAIRPLVPKSPKSKSKGKKASMKIASPPGGGLRPLSLLQDRDVNQETTKPLSLGKKGKAAADENAEPSSGLGLKMSMKAGLKPLRLTRSETTKERAALRRGEVLPDVVVRPPSEVERGVLGGYGWA